MSADGSRSPSSADSGADLAADPRLRTAHSATHTEFIRRAGQAQRETLTATVQHEFGLDRPSAQPVATIRRNCSAPSLSHLDDGLPRIVIGICGEAQQRRQGVAGCLDC